MSESAGAVSGEGQAKRGPTKSGSTDVLGHLGDLSGELDPFSIAARCDRHVSVIAHFNYSAKADQQMHPLMKHEQPRETRGCGIALRGVLLELQYNVGSTVLRCQLNETQMSA